VNCNSGSEDCKPQRLLYSGSLSFSTATKADPIEGESDGESDSHNNKSSTLSIIAFLLGALVLAAMGYAAYYWYKVTHSEDGTGQQGPMNVWEGLQGMVAEMVAFTSSSSSGSSSSHGGSQHGSSHGLTSSMPSSSYLPPGSESRGNGIWSTISSSARNLSSFVSTTNKGQSAANRAGVATGGKGSKGYSPLAAQQRAGSAFVVEDEDDIDIAL
jgi:hypothetical protein